MKNKSNMFLIFILLAMVISSMVLYPILPDVMPSHYNINGEIDSVMGKQMYVVVSNLTMIILFVMMKYLPKIDPKKDNYKQFEKYYDFIVLGIMIFFLVVHMIIMISALGFNINVSRVICFMLGLLFVCLGYCCKETKLNYFVGVKTPWTLSDEDVWNKTNKLFGVLISISGILIIFANLIFSLRMVFVIMMIAISVVTIIPLIGSYVFYKNK